MIASIAVGGAAGAPARYAAFCIAAFVLSSVTVFFGGLYLLRLILP